MGRRKDERERCAAIVREMIDDLEAGRIKHWWDAAHQPRLGERDGRIAMLWKIMEEIMGEHSEAKGSE